jgi:aminoglycoside phosphotransferase (APT) family kinase protein
VTECDLPAQLLAVLRRRLDLPHLDYAEAPTTLSGGFWAEILAFRLDGAPPELSGGLVARIMPDDRSGVRETVIQREVADQGFPAPIVRLAGPADDGLGRPYMVMDRSAGVPLMSGLTPVRAIGALPRLLRRLPSLLATTALQLHLLDPGPIKHALGREVPGAAVDTSDMLARLTVTAEHLDVADLRAATSWLADHQPVPDPVCVCHGDLHPFNLLVDHDRQVTLVDWTASLIAEPAFDLAFTTLLLREASVPVPRPFVPAIRAAASRLADRVLSTYREAAAPHGIVIDGERLAWHTALHSTRVLTEVAGWEAAGEITARQGHPFLSMADRLRQQLAATTGA